MKLMLFAVVLLLQQISLAWPLIPFLEASVGEYVINEDYEFWTLDCKRRPGSMRVSMRYVKRFDKILSRNWRFDQILSPDSRYDEIYKACGGSSCRDVRSGYNCKDICNETFQESDEDSNYGDLESCPTNYGFIGYCKDKRGLDQYIRICMKDYLYPNPGVPLITRSGDCTGEGSCKLKNKHFYGLRYGDGDCDRNSHCAAGLWCGNNNCRSMHKKDNGRGCFDSTDDCCTGSDPWARAKIASAKKALKEKREAEEKRKKLRDKVCANNLKTCERWNGWCSRDCSTSIGAHRFEEFKKYCREDPDFMKKNCRKACKLC